jgi:hypothetical protein
MLIPFKTGRASAYDIRETGDGYVLGGVIFFTFALLAVNGIDIVKKPDIASVI